MSTVSSYQRSSKYSTAELALMGVRGHAYAIYHQLLNTINMKTGLCNPKHKTLAAKLQISVSTVRRHLKNLAELGLIAWRKSFHKVEHTGKYRQSSNEVVIYEVEDQLPNTCGDKNEQGGYSDRASINPSEVKQRNNKNISSLEVLRQRYEEAGFSEFDKFLEEKVLPWLRRKNASNPAYIPVLSEITAAGTTFLKTLIADRDERDQREAQIVKDKATAEEKEEAIILPENTFEDDRHDVYEALKNKVYRKSELVKHYELLCISCVEEQPDDTILLVADSTKYHGNIQFAVNNIRQWQEDIQIELKRKFRMDAR